MIYYQNETKQNMFNSYNNMTPVERSIADFFLSNTEKMDFSSKNISKRLYVSEAALSRFSKKCGYKGYRELIFSYEKDLENDIPKEDIEPDISSFTKKIKGSYASILQEEFGLLNEKQIRKVVEKLENARKIRSYIWNRKSRVDRKGVSAAFYPHRTPDGGSDRCAVNADVCGAYR